jgi:hypothetical protein
MRSLVTIGFAALLSGAFGAAAAPARPDPAAMPDVIVPVQMRCDARACFDPRTGAYTRSLCDSRGCRPVGGVVEYLGQATRGHGGPRGYGYETPPAYGYGSPHGYGYGYQRGYGPRPGQYAPPAGMSQQEYEAYRAGSGGG